MLRQASEKQYKYHKLIVNGDFNATTGLSTKQCYYDGKKLVEDPVCNDNGLRLKQFSQEKLLSMSQSFLIIKLKIGIHGSVVMELQRK